MTEYVLNPSLRIITKSAEKNNFLVVQNALTRKEWEYNRIFGVLFSLGSNPYDLASLKGKLESQKVDDVDQLFDFFIQEKILIEHPTNYSKWIEMGWRSALYFHLLSRDMEYLDANPNDFYQTKSNVVSEYLSDSPLPLLFKELNFSSIPLSLTDYSSSEKLGEVMLKRRTSRQFSGKRFELTSLSKILGWSSEPVKKIRLEVEEKIDSDPAQAINSYYSAFEIYFFSKNVEGLLDGLYHYNLRKNTVQLIKQGNFESEMVRIAIGQGVSNCNVIIMISANYHRYMWRYRHPRALRNLYMDCGSLGHRFILTATALGCKSFVTPAIRDSIADSLFNLDGESENMIYLIGIGN